MHGTVRVRDVRRDQVPQAVRTGGGFVHLVTTAAATSAVSTAAVTLTAVTARAATVALRLALASRSEPGKTMCSKHAKKAF